MNVDFDVVIVGAGHAGSQVAIALRQAKYTGSILIIGDEPHLPYERPPLTKDYLSRAKTFERILIRPPSFWADKSITLHLGVRVVKVDPVTQSVRTDQDSEITYGSLVWAAGGSARRLTCEGHGTAGVHSLRTRTDTDLLMAELEGATRAVIIGGGYIGLEAASALRKLGKEVVVLEAQDRVLARVAGEQLSRFFEAEHRAQGVDIRLQACVEGIVECDGRVAGVRLANGEILPADVVIVGIGIVPAVEPLLVAGADGGNGVAVDHLCRTSLANIFAVGDCALRANAYADGASLRVESVQNANDQGTLVASAITGRRPNPDAVPWFWSNQYDIRLQTVGISLGYDKTIVRGEPETRSFSIIYLKDRRVIALDCVNATKDYAQGRALVVSGTEFDPHRLSNQLLPLNGSAS